MLFSTLCLVQKLLPKHVNTTSSPRTGIGKQGSHPDCERSSGKWKDLVDRGKNATGSRLLAEESQASSRYSSTLLYQCCPRRNQQCSWLHAVSSTFRRNVGFVSFSSISFDRLATYTTLGSRIRSLFLQITPKHLEEAKLGSNLMIEKKKNTLTVPLSGNKRIAHIFTSYFVKEKGGDPVLGSKVGRWTGFEILNQDDSNRIFRRKKEIWTRSGRVSHSDCAFIADRLLYHSDHGLKLRKMITTRFPEFIVDELQDTGWHLSKIIAKLISFEDTKAFLVGDPHQAIYEFTGASPKLFERFWHT